MLLASVVSLPLSSIAQYMCLCTIRYDTIRCDTIRYDTIRFYSGDYSGTRARRRWYYCNCDACFTACVSSVVAAEYVCLVSHSRHIPCFPQQTRNAKLMLVQCWPDGGPTLNQQRFSIRCLHVTVSQYLCFIIVLMHVSIVVSHCYYYISLFVSVCYRLIRTCYYFISLFVYVFQIDSHLEYVF